MSAPGPLCRDLDSGRRDPDSGLDDLDDGFDDGLDPGLDDDPDDGLDSCPVSPGLADWSSGPPLPRP
jgi:hypothetical protein